MNLPTRFGACVIALAAMSPAAVSAAVEAPEGITVEQAQIGAAWSEAAAIVGGMSIAEQAASVIMATTSTLDPETARSFVSQHGLGGFIIMDDNVGFRSDIRPFTDAIAAAADIPPLIGVDQEGGTVSRFSWDDAAWADTLEFQGAAATERAFAERGAIVADAGATVNFGIVADVTADRTSYIYPRVLARTAWQGTSQVAAAVTGEQPSVLSTVKHFPGHGAVDGDSHFDIPVSDLTAQQWAAQHAAPFQAGIAAGTGLVMTAHLEFPEIAPGPASLAPEWYRVLREDMAFAGIAVTDDLGMLVQTGLLDYVDLGANAVGALSAGADLVLVVATATDDTPGALIAAIEGAVTAGQLPPERLEEAATRVMEGRLLAAGHGRALVRCDGDCS